MQPNFRSNTTREGRHRGGFLFDETQAPAVVLPLRAIGCDNARSLLPAQVWVDSESTANFAFVAKMWAVVSQSSSPF